MSFTSAHNDYLDPDIHNSTPEDYGLDELLTALKKRDNGRWNWDSKLISIDDEFAYATARVGKTFAGTDVCLNVPKWVDRQESGQVYYKVRDIYMEQAQEIVWGCSVPGEWDGDSWVLSDSAAFKAPVILDPTGVPKFDETADALIAAGEKALAGVERELALADDMLSQLAGWTTIRKNGKKHHHKEGRPCQGSAWSMYRWTKNA